MSDRALPRESARRRPAAEAGPYGRVPAADAGVRVLHAAVPGRVRLSVAGVRRAPAAARDLEALARNWTGVRRAAANPVTGNLLLEFDAREVPAEQLVARVQEWAAPAANRRRQGGAVPNGAASSPPRGDSRPRGIKTAGAVPAEIMAALEAAPVPPPLPLRTREWEAALGGLALLGAGAMLLAVRAYGHNLAIDQVPLALAQELHRPALTTLMRGASRLAEPAVLWPATLGAALLGVGRQRAGELPWLAPAAVGGGATLISVLKVLLRRTRPTAFPHLSAARGYSLPSGHAFLAATLYGLLAHHGLRWLRARRPDDRRAAAALLIVATAAVLLVGISRIYLGVHYPTDVIAGYALALLWLLFLAAVDDSAHLQKE